MPHDPETGDHFVPLAAMGDLASARIAAAVLEADGIETRLHGEALGPYRLTVGEMAVVELWVRRSRRDAAQQLLDEAAIENVHAPSHPDAATPLPPGVWAAILFAGAMLLLGLVRWVL